MAPGALRTLGLVSLAAVAACTSSANSQTTPHGAACIVQVSRQLKPPPGYIEVGQLSFDAQAAGLTKYHYTNPDQLARDMHDNICAIGGELLTTERNALGVITRAGVYRRERELALPPPPPATEQPSRSEPVL